MQTMFLLFAHFLSMVVGVQTPTNKIYNQPFLWDVSHLPVGFTGHSIGRICDVLLDRTKPKGEFETTSAYEQRIKGAGDAPIDSLKLGVDLLSFEVRETSFDYMADDGLFNVTQAVAVQGSSFALPLNHAEITDQRDYTATNAYGAVVRVSKGTFYGYQFAPTNEGAVLAYASEVDRKTSIRFRTPLKISFRFALPMEKARDVKPSLKLFVINKLRAPYVATRTDSHRATLTNPTEGTFYTHTLLGEFHGFLVLNTRTGEILYKVKAQGS